MYYIGVHPTAVRCKTDEEGDRGLLTATLGVLDAADGADHALGEEGAHLGRAGARARPTSRRPR
eukprot:8306544-Alexandrium_andersonii.AAC.1